MKRKFRIIGSFIQNCYSPVKSSRRYNRRSVGHIIIISAFRSQDNCVHPIEVVEPANYTRLLENVYVSSRPTYASLTVN